MIKIRNKFDELLEAVSSYGFALYKGASDLLEGFETLLCATFWFFSLMVLFIVDLVLCIAGICIDTLIKAINAFMKITGLKI